MGARRIVKKTSTVQPSVQPWLTRRLLGGVMLISAVGGLLIFAVWQLAQPSTLPIQQVQVKGEFVYIDKKDLYEAIGDLANAGFFNVDVRAVKQAAEDLAWVESASVRRIWPGTLQVDIREQIPLARWQGGGIVNRHGELVPVAAADALSQLPVFSGPDGTEKILASRYQKLSESLAKIKLAIMKLTLSERRAWQVSLNNGVHLLLGRSALDTQISRFVVAYGEVLAEDLARIQSVDLRYTNGFSVRWKAQSS